MLKSCVCAVFLLGAATVMPISAIAAPLAPQSAPGVSSVVPVQGYGGRCRELRERIRELEARMHYAPPYERGRMERRLYRTREEFRFHCRRGY
jgi:hypothetical protein